MILEASLSEMETNRSVVRVSGCQKEKLRLNVGQLHQLEQHFYRLKEL